MKRATFMLSPGLGRGLERRARAEGRSPGEVVRLALAAYLERAKAPVDVFLADDVVFDGKTPANLSADHDRYLYGSGEG